MRAPLLQIALCLLVAQLHAARVLVDDAGRNVNIPDRVERIVCLAPSLVDDVFSMGAGAQVVAVSDFTKYPAEARSKPSTGSPASPSLERILALHPDVVLGTIGINRPETVHLLEQHGVSVFMVATVGLRGLYASLERIGQVIGHQADAASLIARLRTREIGMRRQTSGRSPMSVFVPLWYDPVFTIGKPAFVTDLLGIIGLRSVTEDITQEWPTVSLEAIIQRNPDMLLLLTDNGVHDQELSKKPGWNTLRAVREHKFLYSDDRLELPSPVCFDALPDLARQVSKR